MAEDETTTSNYFQVAVSDDITAITKDENEPESSTSNAPVLDKAEIRKQRIEAAVQRSKGEYKSEHAYTERDWFTNPETERNVLSKPKVDKQHLEYITTSLYYSTPPKYQEALQLILNSFDSKAKHSGGLSRELLDTGLRCSLRCNDIENSIKLADSSKILWKGQFAGISALASDVYLLADRPKDALAPLVISTSSFGLHAPILTRLSHLLKSIISSDQGKEYTSINHLLGILERVIVWKSNYLQKPLFDDLPEPSQPIDSKSMDTNIDISFDQPLNLSSIIQELDLDEEKDEDTINGLKGTINRLNKGFKNDNEDQVVEKSVREL